MELYTLYVAVVLDTPRGSYYKPGVILFDTAAADEKGVRLKYKERYPEAVTTTVKVNIVKYVPFGMDIW